MIIYKDFFTGDELFSDVLPVKDLGALYEVEGKNITVSGDCGIASNDEAGLDDADQTVINVVHNHKLVKTTFSKPQFQSWVKGYMGKLLAKVKDEAHLPAPYTPAEVTAFQKGATDFVKQVLGNFKDYDFYMGESLSAEGQIIIAGWSDDGLKPIFYFWKAGLLAEKC